MCASDAGAFLAAFSMERRHRFSNSPESSPGGMMSTATSKPACAVGTTGRTWGGQFCPSQRTANAVESRHCVINPRLGRCLLMSMTMPENVGSWGLKVCQVISQLRFAVIAKSDMAIPLIPKWLANARNKRRSSAPSTNSRRGCSMLILRPLAEMTLADLFAVFHGVIESFSLIVGNTFDAASHRGCAEASNRSSRRRSRFQSKAVCAARMHS